ncbi:MAG: glycosyltransferase family 2 protein, partial [Balneola sp.]
MDTKASVIVRSFNRLPALLELLDVLRTQKYKNFEIIIVEQSTNYEGNDWEKLNEIEAEDHRIKLLKYTPLGGPKARNEGVKNATGEILIFIDDDDLPFSDQWVAEHVEAYKDPMLIGFTGRHVLNDKTGDPYK